MSKALDNKLKNLNNLHKLRKELKAKTVDKRFTELNIFDRTSQLYAPITNVFEKQNENLEVLKNNLTNNNHQRILPPPEIFKSIRDHSIFFPIDVEMFYVLDISNLFHLVVSNK